MANQEETKKEYRIPNTTGALMLVVAGVYDLLSIIPFVNYIVIPVAWLTFWMWFEVRGINIGFANPKRLLTMGGTSIIEAIPVLGNISPTWILGIGLQLLFIRVEDKTGISPTSIADLGKGNIKKFTRRAQQPLEKQREAVGRVRNIQGIREQRGKEHGSGAV